MQVTARVLYRTVPDHPKPWTVMVSITTVIDMDTVAPAAAAVWLAERVRLDWIGEGPGHYRLVGGGRPNRWFTEGDAIVIDELETVLVSNPLGWDTSIVISRDDIDWTGAGATPEPIEVPR